VFFAVALGSILMTVGGEFEIVFGVTAERQRLERVAKPLKPSTSRCSVQPPGPRQPRVRLNLVAPRSTE
jgi:hypothetical protein